MSNRRRGIREPEALVRRSPRISSRKARYILNPASHQLNHAVSVTTRESLRRPHSRTPPNILNESGQAVPLSFDDDETTSTESGGSIQVMHHLYGLDNDEMDDERIVKRSHIYSVGEKVGDRIAMATTSNDGICGRIVGFFKSLLFKFGSLLYLTATAILCLDVIILHRLFNARPSRSRRPRTQPFFLFLILCALIAVLLGGKMLPFTPISDDTVRIKLSDSELEPLKLSIINSISFDIQKAFEARFKQLENLFDLRIQQAIGNSEDKMSSLFRGEIGHESDLKQQAILGMVDKLWSEINTTIEHYVGNAESLVNQQLLRLPEHFEQIKAKFMAEFGQEQNTRLDEIASELRKEFSRHLKSLDSEINDKLVDVRNMLTQYAKTAKETVLRLEEAQMATANNVSAAAYGIERHEGRISVLEDKQRQILLQIEDFINNYNSRLRLLETSSNNSVPGHMVVEIFNEELEKATADSSSPLRQWLNLMFASKVDVQDLSKHVSDYCSRGQGSGDSSGVSRYDVEQMMSMALHRYSADKIAKFDFALEDSGGVVLLGHCSPSYTHGVTTISLFGWIPLWHVPTTPKVIIQPTTYPGNCWAMQGQSGYATIKLKSEVVVTGVTLDHIPRELSPNGSLDSAPKDFTVYGLNSVRGEHTPLGTFTYNIDSTMSAIQQFSVKPTVHTSFNFVKFDFTSNYGNPDYTCVYRVRVHGHLP